MKSIDGTLWPGEHEEGEEEEAGHGIGRSLLRGHGWRRYGRPGGCRAAREHSVQRKHGVGEGEG